MGRRIVLLLAACFLSASLWGAARRVQVPQDGVAPDVAVDNAGHVDLVFAREGDAWFARSLDGGKTFSRPARLNTVPHQVLGGHERGPKIALSPDGTLHVVWMGAKSDGLFYTRRLPGEKSFSAPRNLLDAQTTLDGATVAAGARGTVFVAWLDGRMPADPRNPVSLPVYWSESRDDGRTFSKNEPAVAGIKPDTSTKIHQPQEGALVRACSCCALRALAGPEGDFYLGFRGAQHNIRDMFLADFALSPADPRIRVTRIHDDHWEFDACPMSGPFLAVGPRRLWAAWMSRGKVYAAGSAGQGRDFSSPFTPRPAKEGKENHPLVLVNQRGEIFLAWEEGGEILWQISDAAGQVRDSGDAGALPDNSKATGFVDREGDFCLVF